MLQALSLSKRGLRLFLLWFLISRFALTYATKLLYNQYLRQGRRDDDVRVAQQPLSLGQRAGRAAWAWCIAPTIAARSRRGRQLLSAAVLTTEKPGAIAARSALRRRQAQPPPTLVPSVYDAGEADLPDGERAIPFVVMELVEGPSLHERGPTGLDELLAIAGRFAPPGARHTRGIGHSRSEPENVLLAPTTGLAPLSSWPRQRSQAERLWPGPLDGLPDDDRGYDRRYGVLPGS